MNNYKKLESGRSMIEMLGVLAIIGVLSVGGIAGYSKAMNKFKTNKVADQVSMLVANIKTMYAQQNTYEGLSNETAISLGVVPDELVVKTKGTDNNEKTELLNSFNGPVFIFASDSTGKDDNKAFTIEFNNLSKEACITLATNDWGSGYSSGLIALRAAGKSATEATDKLKTVYIGNEGTPGRKEVKAEGNNKGNDNDVIATPGGQAGARVPLSVTSAAVACGCKAGNTCSLQWKYY